MLDMIVRVSGAAKFAQRQGRITSQNGDLVILRGGASDDLRTGILNQSTGVRGHGRLHIVPEIPMNKYPSRILASSIRSTGFEPSSRS